MLDPVPASITNVSAEADHLTVFLSRGLETAEEIADWENLNNYELQRTHAGSLEDPPLVDTLTYDETDPNHPQVVIHLVVSNVPGDSLHLKYIKAGEESDSWDLEFGELPDPDPDDIDWEEMLTGIDDAVHNIQNRLPPLEDAARVITDEIPDDFDDSIETIEARVLAIDGGIQEILKLIGMIQTDIGNLQAKLEPIENIEATLEPIARIDGNVIELGRKAQIVADAFPAYEGYIKGQFDTIIKAVVTDRQEPLLDEIEGKLEGQRDYLTNAPAEHGETLAEQIAGNWQSILPLFRQAQESRRVPQVAREKIVLLQTEIRRDISFMGTQIELIRRRPALVNDARLISTTVAGIDDALDSLRDIRQTIQDGGIRL